MIHDKILVALGAFDSQGRVLPGSVAGKKASATTILGRLTVIFMGVGVILYFISEAAREKGGHKFEDVPFIILALGCWVFIAYLVAVVIGAFKK